MTTLDYYALIAALTCSIVSVGELIFRYPHSAQISTLVGNRPAAAYLSINFFVGAAAVYISSTTGAIDFLANNSSTCIEGIGKAILSGFAGLGVLRSNFVSLGDSKSEIALGPSAILDRLKGYLDRKIDLLHKISVDKDIMQIMKNIDPDKARHDLPALCLTGVKQCTKQEIDDFTTTINELYGLQLSPYTRSMMMGHAIYKLFGIGVLQSSVQQLGDLIKADIPLSPPSKTETLSLLSALQEAKIKLTRKD